MVQDELCDFSRSKLDFLDLEGNSLFKMTKIILPPLYRRNGMEYSAEEKLEAFVNSIEIQFQTIDIANSDED